MFSPRPTHVNPPGSGQAADSHLKHRRTRKRSQTPPAFWNNLSRVPLCLRALRAYDRRAVGIKPPDPSVRFELDQDLRKQLKRFARRGGPDCQDIIAYPSEHTPVNHAVEITSRGQQDSSSGKSSTMVIGTNDPAFEQHLIDLRILPPRRASLSGCRNIKVVESRIGRPRVSSSLSDFSHAYFLEFVRKNETAGSESAVKGEVMSMIMGPHARVHNRMFTVMASMTDEETKKLKPDYYEGSDPSSLDRKVRQNLREYITPSRYEHELLLPNHFIEVKGPLGKLDEMHRQAVHDVVYGCRAMHRILSYERPEQQYDECARSFASTYQSSRGLLSLYASYATAPTEANGRPTYHVIELASYIITRKYDQFVAGLTAFRNLQDLAKEERDRAIDYANGVARGGNPQ